MAIEWSLRSCTLLVAAVCALRQAIVIEAAPNRLRLVDSTVVGRNPTGDTPSSNFVDSWLTGLANGNTGNHGSIANTRGQIQGNGARGAPKIDVSNDQPIGKSNPNKLPAVSPTPGSEFREAGHTRTPTSVPTVTNATAHQTVEGSKCAKKQEKCTLRRKAFVVTAVGCDSQSVELGWCKGDCCNHDVFEVNNNNISWRTKPRCCRAHSVERITVKLQCDNGKRMHAVEVSSATACKCTSKQRHF